MTILTPEARALLESYAPGYILRIQPERLGGEGSWAG